MNFKFLLVSLTILTLQTFPVLACPDGNPEDISYIRRDNNRCEGIFSRIDLASSLRLISLATRKITTLGENLTIRIPQLANSPEPEVVVKAIDARYQLDQLELEFNSQSKSYYFNLPTYVIKKALVRTNKLRGLAKFGTQEVYIPVIIGTLAPRYELVFYAEDSTRFPNVEIRLNDQLVYKTSRRYYQDGEIIFTWDGTWNGRKAPPGRYEFYYFAELEQRANKPPEQVSRSIFFEHHPNWLR